MTAKDPKRSVLVHCQAVHPLERLADAELHRRALGPSWRGLRAEVKMGQRWIRVFASVLAAGIRLPTPEAQPQTRNPELQAFKAGEAGLRVRVLFRVGLQGFGQLRYMDHRAYYVPRQMLEW